MVILLEEIFLSGGGNLKRSKLDHSNIFKDKNNILEILNVNKQPPSILQ